MVKVQGLLGKEWLSRCEEGKRFIIGEPSVVVREVLFGLR